MHPVLVITYKSGKVSSGPQLCASSTYVFTSALVMRVHRFRVSLEYHLSIQSCCEHEVKAYLQLTV